MVSINDYQGRQKYKVGRSSRLAEAGVRSWFLRSEHGAVYSYALPYTISYIPLLADAKFGTPHFCNVLLRGFITPEISIKMFFEAGHLYHLHYKLNLV